MNLIGLVGIAKFQAGEQGREVRGYCWHYFVGNDLFIIIKAGGKVHFWLPKAVGN